MEHKEGGLIDSVLHLDGFRRGTPAPEPGGLSPAMNLLRTWQSERLARTHADLLESARFGRACQFFLSDIYAPKDFSRRDQDIETLYRVMARFLPRYLINVVGKTIELNNQTNRLDQALAEALTGRLGVTDSITPALYAQAYRLCNNYDERRLQIERLVEVGRLVDSSTRRPLIPAALRLAHFPAHAAGWGEVQDFLEHGFTAFKHMGGADEFLDTIYRREMLILERIFAGDDAPFSES